MYVGAITSDEVLFAGGRYTLDNNDYEFNYTEREWKELENVNERDVVIKNGEKITLTAEKYKPF